MDTETSTFETSEMLAYSFASTPLLRDTWRLCRLSNTNSPMGFLTEQIGDIGYVAFGAHLSSGRNPWWGNLMPLDGAGDGLFGPLRCLIEEEEEKPVMVHSGFLHVFLSVYNDSSFQKQMWALMEKSRSIIITGHSTGGATAALCALWLLCYLQSNSLSISTLCITFGSPPLGNESLSFAILRERWGGNFCHVVSKHDLMPRLLFTSFPAHLDSLLQFWNLCINSPHLKSLPLQLHDQSKAEVFNSLLASLEALECGGNGMIASSFWPFGNYLFCSNEGAICLHNAASVIKMLCLLLKTGSFNHCVEDHLKYEHYVESISSHFMMNGTLLQGEVPVSSYEASIALALQSSGITSQESIAAPAKECLNAARHMGLTPNLNCAKLAIRLSKITPYRVEIEWYKTCSERSDDQMGYYDAFKQRGASIRDSRVNMNRHKLGTFWDNVIRMLDNNQLPHDFHKHAKWVNASQFYKLLVEPLDIAEYYRKRVHISKGHYMSNGRERRYQIFDRWWENRPVKEEQTKRSKFASLTQDSCFWARVEEAKDWLDSAKVENDQRNLVLLWQHLESFARYAGKLVERKEVSQDVIAKNSSYSLWAKDYSEYKSQVALFHSQF